MDPNPPHRANREEDHTRNTLQEQNPPQLAAVADDQWEEQLPPKEELDLIDPTTSKDGGLSSEANPSSAIEPRWRANPRPR